MQPNRYARSFRRQLVLCLEAQNIAYRDAVQARSDFPDGQDFRVDELVDRFTTELPAAAQLRHRQPYRIDAAVQPIVGRPWAWLHVPSRARLCRSRSHLSPHSVDCLQLGGRATRSRCLAKRNHSSPHKWRLWLLCSLGAELNSGRCTHLSAKFMLMRH
jgi:hypothetical protein